MHCVYHAEKRHLLTDWKYVWYATGLYARIVQNIVARGIHMDGSVKNVRQI